MNTKQPNETSKFLSYVLRHEPHAIGLQLDSEGWADVESLIAGAAKDGRILDIALIQAVVSSSDKNASASRMMACAFAPYRATQQPA